MKMRLCGCKECKKMRKNGKVLGTRIMGFWLPTGMNGTYEYYIAPVSDYVFVPRFANGKRVKRKKSREKQQINKAIIDKDA